MGPQEVIVIGAGWAGLSAATALARLGKRVEVLEAAPFAGGRAARVEGPATLRLREGDAHALAWVAEVSPASSPPRFARWLRADRDDLVALSDDDMAHRANLRRRGRWGLTRLERVAARFRDAPSERFDDRSFADFARLYLGRRDGGRWSRWFEDEWLLPSRETSRAAWRALLARRRGGVGYLRAPLDFSSLPFALRLDYPVKAVVRERNEFRLTAEGRDDRTAEAVVLATPADVSARFVAGQVTSAESSLLAGVRYRSALSFHARLSCPAGFTCSEIAFPGERAPVLSRVSLAAGVEHAETEGHIVAHAHPDFARRAESMPDDIALRIFDAALRAILPETLCEFDAPSLERSRAPAFAVGQVRRIDVLKRLVAEERRCGRALAYAGDFLTEPTLEGAVRSGLSAVDALFPGQRVSAG